MDGALQQVVSAPVRYVTAREIAERFHGDVPGGMRFSCPYCTRPVTICADGSPDVQGPAMPRSRASVLRNSPDPYSRHSKNDRFAQACPFYRSGAESEQESMVPPVMMFLRREQDGSRRFHLEVGFRSRGRRLAERLDAEQATVTVDGKELPLAALVGDRRKKLRIEMPTFRLADRIIIPEHWRRSVGRIEDGDGLFVFTDEFGGNGGRRVNQGASLHAGYDYYLVMPASTTSALESLFDITEHMGTVTAKDASWQVTKVRVLAQSRRRDRVDGWLVRHGFRLAEFDISAFPVWPPSIRSAGVDEPLFRDAMAVYRAPYLRPDDPTADRVDRHTFLPKEGTVRGRPRDIGLVGFGAQCTPAHDMEASCLFIRPSRYLPWNSVIVGRAYPQGLNLAAPPEDPLEGHSAVAVHDDDTHNDAMEDKEGIPCAVRSDTLMAELQTTRNCGLDVARRRRGCQARYGLPGGVVIARTRKG
ncbi:hypothetical protein H7U32_01465 [Bifidobacterium pullorum subsp. saeculare]|uniref:Uncharacterized protein n=1 Tax=Bifidobacterium pullorum subsp. saeculare TaxID=78257 RepID=A0A938WWS1_9BIFI|nr:hypothetical protein [Bifidobacterium pullorum]MBM6699015.1 hypothetical protein [Bifidobacterium pullorum subsp. saeculare]